jgi:hypothetical protein
MNRTQLPAPPNPSSYGANTQQWQQAVYQWMSQVKSRIETDSMVNTAPIAPFVVSSYTYVNTMTGTDALSNFVATLVEAMQTKGITAPNSQRLG